jgi:hypothetical protein
MPADLDWVAQALPYSLRRGLDMFLILLLIPFQVFAATKRSVDIKRWNAIQSVEYTNSIKQKDLELYVPADDLVNLAAPQVEPTKDLDFNSEQDYERNQKVGKKIMDHTFKNFAKGKFTPNASIFRTVKNLEESMKYDITIPKTKADDIEHKINLQYQPFQNMAKVKYRGFLQANLEYHFSDSKLECSVEKELAPEVLMALTHGNDTISPNNDSVSMLMMRWEWR